jgi:hypothetical protein
MEEEPLLFSLDDHHLFEQDKVIPVCGNTWFMLANTRYRSFFEFIGNFERHYGIFEGCGTSLPYAENAQSEQADPSGQSCC